MAGRDAVASAPLVQIGQNYHRLRKRIHWVFFAVFLILPFFNIIRCDIPNQRFYFAGQELRINEFSILFFTMMFLMFVIAGVSLVWGRVYCSYACPQMIFSEFSLYMEERIKKLVNKKLIQLPAARRILLARLIFYSLLLVLSVFLSFIFISYFVDPWDLLKRLSHFDIVTAGGIAGAVTTIFTFLDFAFVRVRFCTLLCPYGYLQGMMSDRNSLLVHYREEGPKKECIECKKCVRICHMGIDIRNSPFQIECIHCGECIDACDDIMARLGKPGLIHYAWGEQGVKTDAPGQTWYQKLGIRDAKRVVILLVLGFYGSGLFTALSMRENIMVRVSPDRSKLSFETADGQVSNRYKIEVANRSNKPGSVTFVLDGAPGLKLVAAQNPVPVQAGETSQTVLEVVAMGAPQPGVHHFRFLSSTIPDGSSAQFPMTFIMPEKKNK